jgi:N12 class adenine-specific DNA methylase
VAARPATLTPKQALADNLAALGVVAAHRGEADASPSIAERALLDRWHGWGAAAQVFDRPEFADERQQLEELLGEAGYRAARRNTLNAHYTDPALVAAIWRTVAAAGITEGSFIEPGCGRGTFLALAPEGMRGLGVELDPTTARVADLLADRRHDVHNADFAKLSVTRGRATAAVGNVPFSEVGLFDPEFNPDRALSMHDHFCAKAAATLRPGGVAILITSRYTLDKRTPGGREFIGQFADFVGAVRLPSSAHRQEAGTSVVTDVLVLRGRAPGAPADHAPGFLEPVAELAEWQGQALFEPMPVSTYFAENPSRVLGELQVTKGPFGVQMKVTGVVGGEDLAKALAPLVVGWERPNESLAPDLGPDALLTTDLPREQIDRIEREPNGLFRRRELEGWTRHDPGGQRTELAALIDLRDQVRDLVLLEGSTDAAEEVIEARRVDLAAAYRRYVTNYGPINRVTVNPETDRRSYPRMGGFRKDPDFARVAALEVYDEETNHASPASVLEHRVLRPAEPPDHVDNAVDALSVCLSQIGRVDQDYLARLTGQSVDQVWDELGDRVFRNPPDGRWVVAEEYLSGNVRRKLAVATPAAADDASFDRNVAALAVVVPRDIVADELENNIGAPWIEPPLVEEFARSLCPIAYARDSITVSYSANDATWVVRADTGAKLAMSGGHPFGGASFDALHVLGAALNGRSPVVYTADSEGNRVVDPAATTAATEKAEQLGEAFDAWLLREDPDRTAVVLARYNELFNAYVPRSYAGVTITAPGLRSDFSLRPHQHQAVARMVYGRDALLAHAVGAGKTAELIVGAMERKRLGMCALPCFVVPNHMLDQFARDVAGLYPAAEVLSIDKDDISPSKRALFAARVTSHRWDAVVITHASFTRWGVSPEATTRILEEKVAELQGELQSRAGSERGADRTITKGIEKRILNYEERLKAARSAVANLQDDHGFHFDQSGIDYLCVDEGHEFKSAPIVTSARNLRGVPAGAGSLRAVDLDEKLRCLRDQWPDRAVATFATGTPVTNTVAELWVLASYLRPDLLDELGISAFDAFRAQFTTTTSEMELDASGTRIRRIERLARYKNLPELGRILGEFADIVMDDDLDLPKPDLVGGKRRVVVVEPAPAMETFMTEVVSARADAIHNRMVLPTEDNMLKLCSDCRLAAFDWQSYSGQSVPDVHSPLARAADQIAQIYQSNVDRAYLSAGGRPHPRRGAFQLAFADLGTPKGDGRSAYDRLRQMLVDRGVPAEKIGVIHEHDSDDKKARFFAACRDGRYAVALSSTPKMGQGTNVQDRMVALHHLSVPWRPSDVEQREGRILRQGNQNPEVEVFVYVVERSFAAFGWQTVQRKAAFMGQLLRADPDGPRVLEVTDAEALAYGEIKALSTGDDTFLEVAGIEDRIGRLERLQRSHGQEQGGLHRREESILGNIDALQRKADALAEPAARVLRHEDGLARMVIGGHTYDQRGDAARALSALLHRYRALGTIVEFPAVGIGADWYPGEGSTGTLRLNVPGVSISIGVTRRDHDGLVGVLTQVKNQVAGLPSRRDEALTQVARLTDELPRVRAAIGKPFSHADELKQTRQTLARLQAVLAERYGPPEREPSAVTPEPGPEADAAWNPEVNRAGLAQVRALLAAGATPAADAQHADPGEPAIRPEEAAYQAVQAADGLDPAGYER